MIPGIDVSSVQGNVQWPLVALHGVRFAWIKCGQGNDGADPMFHVNIKGCRDTGIVPGAYWFAYNLPPQRDGDGRSPREEAQRFFRLSGGLGRGHGELPPAIDAEWPEVGDWGKWGCTAPQISAWHKQFAMEVTQLWGRLPLIYTYPWWWNFLSKGADVEWAAQYPLWIANYMHIEKEAPPPGASPVIPHPWAAWAAWQWSANKGRHIPGILTDIDRNMFAGDEAAFRQFSNMDPERETLPAIDDPSSSPTIHVVPDTAADFLARDVSDLGLPRIPNSDPPDDDAA